MKIKRSIFVFLLIVLNISQTIAEDLSLGNGLVISQKQVEEITNLLPKTTVDKFYFHWTNRKNGLRWVTQKNIDAGEMAFLNRPTHNMQASGPGFYMASDPISSKGFGDFPITVEIKKGTPIYDSTIIKSILRKEITKEQASLLGEKIPFIRQGNQKEWFVTNHPVNTKKVGYAFAVSPEARIKDIFTWNVFTLMDDLSEVANTNADANYLRKIIALSDYQDGISFARSMKVNPENPWNEFDPHFFEAFQKSLSELKESTSIRYRHNWDLKKAPEELAKIFSLVSGSNKNLSLDEIIRTEGVRAGGNDSFQMFNLNEESLKELNSNEYLEVISKKDEKGKIIAEYFYPDAFHYKKLEGKISTELFSTLRKMNPDLLMKDADTRQKLNEQIIKELLEHVLKKYDGTPFQADRFYEHFINFMKDLISIHPFSDFNGRSIRMYFKLAFKEAGKAPHFFMSDMDLLASSAKQNALLNSASKEHRKLFQNLVEEFSMAQTQNRMPDYSKAIDWNEFILKSLSASTIGHIDLDNPKIQNMIKNREWDKIIDSIKENRWEKFGEKLSDTITRSEAKIALANYDLSNDFIATVDSKDKYLSLLKKEIISAPITKEYELKLFKDYEKIFLASPSNNIKADLKIILKHLIEKGDRDTLLRLAGYTFSEPYTEGMGDLFKLLIEKADNEILQYLPAHVFSKPHTEKMQDSLKLLIEKGDSQTLTNLAKYTFSQPNAEKIQDSLKLLIKKADAQTLQELAKNTFVNPHAEKMQDSLKLLIKKADAQTLQNLARFTFSQPHAEKIQDSLKLLIKKGDSQTLTNLARYTFTAPHAEKIQDSLKLLIEKGDTPILKFLKEYTFTQPHTKNMYNSLRLLIQEALKIKDHNKRSDFLRKYFEKNPINCSTLFNTLK